MKPQGIILSSSNWDAPIYGTICINCDVAVNSTSVGIGMVFREANEKPVTGTCFIVGHCSVLVVEMLASWR